MKLIRRFQKVNRMRQLQRIIACRSQCTTSFNLFQWYLLFSISFLTLKEHFPFPLPVDTSQLINLQLIAVPFSHVNEN